jgi:hypothetical protein
MIHKIKCPKCGANDKHELDEWQTHLHCKHCVACFTTRKIADTCIAVYEGWLPVFNNYGFTNNGSF